MRIEALQFKKPDKTEVKIYVCAIENYGFLQWSISDIAYREFRGRTWKSLEKLISNEIQYRGMSNEEKTKYKMQKYIDFVGKGKLSEALYLAWESIEPDFDKILCV